MWFGRKIIIYCACLWAICAVGPGLAQSKQETLADIRQELTFLHNEIQSLKRELSTTSGATTPTGAGTHLQRIDALEQEFQRITGVMEQLQFRIDRIVQDGTNRIGDLEFRLVELEGGDVTKLGQTTTLGGETQGVSSGVSGVSQTRNSSSGVELAVSEKDDFDRALAAYESGNALEAVKLFDQFLLSYPGGPLTGEAHYWRAEALATQEDWRNAARAFLESFSGSPQGSKAPKSLLRLGMSLAKLGQVQDACIMLNEVEIRYPNTNEVAEAKAEIIALNCV